MDVNEESEIIKEIQIIEQYFNVIENDVKKVNEDCNKINCSAVYQSIEVKIKLIIDCISSIYMWVYAGEIDFLACAMLKLRK